MRASRTALKIFMGVLSQIAALAAISPEPGFAQASSADGATALHVRMYDAFGVPSRCMRTAERTLKDIFSRAGVPLMLRKCRSGSDAPAPECGEPLRAGDTAIRLIRSPLGQGGRALGLSLVGGDALRPSLATVFVDRVEAAAERSGTQLGLVLGRTIAHELGHVLLGSAHTPKGLMRSGWSDRDLRENYPRDYWFAPDQVKIILRRLAETPGLNPVASSVQLQY
jgi:hypothetical protein